MRLNEKEIDIIKSTIGQYTDDPLIYLFGSRMDESKKGGDIDLYIISGMNDYNSKIKIRSELKRLLGKPIDIIFHRDFSRPIEQQALKGVKL